MILPETVCERIRVESNRLSLDPTPSRVWLDLGMQGCFCQSCFDARSNRGDSIPTRIFHYTKHLIMLSVVHSIVIML